MLAHRPDPDDASAQIDLIGVPWMIVSQEPSAVPNGGCVRAGPGAHEEVSAVARRTVALPDRWQRAYQKVPGRSPRGGCRIGAKAFVAGVRGRPRGATLGEGNRDHETDSHDADHRRWSGPGKRRRFG